MSLEGRHLQAVEGAMIGWIGSCLVMAFLLSNAAALVNMKISRIPALLNAVNFGHEIDQDKALVVSNVLTCDASLKMYNVRIDRAAIMRVTYYSVAVMAALLPRLLRRG
mmetsp:Transcript_13442/g.33705  ORF Transcript_13442/g.33705 Transcript_13442/m.33705 type:complete len:109 (-) Transcript_13442:285-611(-)